MKLVYKINGLVVSLLFLGLIIGALMAYASFRNVRVEMYKWFDRGCVSLAASMGAKGKDFLNYFNYKELDDYLLGEIQKDADLLYVSISYGKDLAEIRSAGDINKGPFKAYSFDIRDNGQTQARVLLHYSLMSIEGKLRSLTTSIATSAVITIIVLMVALSMAISRLLNRPLSRLVDYADTVAKGNLTSRVEMARGDELGTLAATFNRMSEHLKEMVMNISSTFNDMERISSELGLSSRRVHDGSMHQADAVANVSSSVSQMNGTLKNVADNVENLFAGAEKSSASILEMSGSVSLVAKNAESLSAAVEQTASSVAQMIVSNQSVVKNIDTLSALISETASSIMEMDYTIKEVERSAGEAEKLSELVRHTMEEEGSAAVGKAVEGMQRIRMAVISASEVIGDLSAKSESIGKIINVIKEVNEQTNLLSLNAAIIAAQAGEHGRGFAVVADEIRELSARTSASTKEITNLIKGVQNGARGAVTAMEEGIKSVEHGVGVIEEVNAILQRAEENSQKASLVSKLIAKSTTEQSQGIKLINDASQSMTQMSREISNATAEQSIGSNQIIKASENMRDLAAQVKKATLEQNEGVRQIGKASEDSTLMAHQILQSTKENSKASQLILENIDRIRQITSLSIRTVDDLDGMVKGLAEQAELLKKEIGRFRLN